ncbi:unnamed protein product [Didymodactylos carnosus]|uniref:G-protein coupled receptors family 1 profile domain-containing protein n=1 Tax=Didymodactylos carnosus TaxID=1234261 RepID=A0A814S7D1_9BILA|nr:unnamed protein product [Didymodactylos carnosus]CAF3907900.1 unnamed protein product [Didymodactylos carnosus]
MASVFDLFLLFFGLILRIVISGFGYNLPVMSVGLCKLRFYLTYVLALSSLTYKCLATIDRCCSTCRTVKSRTFSNLSLARQLCVLTVLFWLLTLLPFPLLTNIYVIGEANQTKSKVCNYYSIIYANFHLYFNSLLCFNLIPIFVMTLFGILTYKNLRNRIVPLHQRRSHRNRIDVQLTKIMLLQTLIVIVSSVPPTILNMYMGLTIDTEKNSFRLAQENLFSTIVTLFFYTQYSTAFYCFSILSKSFREQCLQRSGFRKL